MHYFIKTALEVDGVSVTYHAHAGSLVVGWNGHFVDAHLYTERAPWSRCRSNTQAAPHPTPPTI